MSLEYWFTLKAKNTMAIQDYFCNEITVKKRAEITVYEDWISKKIYDESTKIVPCRITFLSYRDLLLLSKTDDVSISYRKLYTWPDVSIDVKDIIVWDSKEWKVYSEYNAQNKTNVHHNKYFIKLVE